MAAPLDADARTELQDRLQELDGVLHASVEPDAGELWVIRDPDYDQAPVELAVRNQIAGLGHDPGGWSVRLCYPGQPGPRRRVRFDRVERVDENGSVTVTVHLEWAGTVHAGTASGEKGPAIELKTVAHAAVNALEDLSGQRLDLRIIGVKPIHAFDSDLMVASLLRLSGDRQRLVGAVVVTGDPLDAAAVAVLSALNRTLGNFLHTAD